MQIRLSNLKFNEEGYLDKDSQGKLARYLNLNRRGKLSGNKGPHSPASKHTKSEPSSPRVIEKIPSIKRTETARETSRNVKSSQRYNFRPRQRATTKSPWSERTSVFSQQHESRIPEPAWWVLWCGRGPHTKATRTGRTDGKGGWFVLCRTGHLWWVPIYSGKEID